ncbi:MAG: alanine racemase [Pseudomonadota bacterium]
MHFPGTLDDLPTPALLIDLDVVKRNSAAMASRFESLGVALRPHLKTAKAVEVARLATRGHGGGLTVSTLAEAAFFAQAGFRDITWAVTAVPARLAAADEIQRTQAAVIGLIADDPELAGALGAEAARLGTRFRVHVEIDSGEHRTGLAWDDPLVRTTAGVIHAHPALELAGVLTHGGHAYGSFDPVEIARIAEEERLAVVRAAGRLREAGLPCDVVSAGSTPTAIHGRRFDGLTEFRPGVYTLFDLAQVARHCCRIEDIAVAVLTTVLSRQPRHDRAIVDAGALAVSKDLSAAGALPDTGYGWLVARDGNTRVGNLHLEQLDQEHGYATGSPEDLDSLRPLQRLRVLPNHACITAACHDAFWVVSGGQVVDRWPRVSGWEADREDA